MKTLLVGLVAFLACFVSAQELDKNAIKTCNKELDIPDDADYLTHFMNGNMEENEKSKCFIKCIMGEYKVMKDDTLHTERVIEVRKDWFEEMKKKGVVVEEEQMRAAVEACKSAAGESDANCETEYLLGKCATDVFREVEVAHNVWRPIETRRTRK